MTDVNSSPKWRPEAMGVVSLLLMTAGCVRVSTNQGEHVFQYAYWVPASILLSGLAAIPLGLFLRKFSGELAWGLVIIGSIAVLVFAPSLFHDRVVVNNTGFDVRTGIWGVTAIHSVKFADLKEIRFIAETSTNGDASYYFVCESKNGNSSKVPVNNTVTQAAADLIIHEAQAAGIAVRDLTGN